MHKCLYLVCPTDCLEPIINNTFKQEHYFYTSLGNAFVADGETLEHIKRVVQNNGIRKICFVLSSNNQIVEDALGHQDFSDIKGLNTFYAKIIQQKNNSKLIERTANQQFLVVSYFLNKKIAELQLALEYWNLSAEISGKIYNSTTHTFKPIYPRLVCLEKHQLN